MTRRIVAVALAAASLSPAAAHAGWPFGEPVALTAGAPGSHARVVLGAGTEPDGTQDVAYAGSGHMWVLRRGDGNKPQAIGGADPAHEDLAPAGAFVVGADGSRLVAWARDDNGPVDELAVAFAAPGKPFGKARLYATADGPSSVQAAIGADGTMVVAWAQSAERSNAVRTVIRRPDGTFSAPQTLAARGHGNGRSPTGAAVAADGTAFVAWYGSDVAPAQLSVLAPGATAFTDEGAIPDTQNEPIGTFTTTADGSLLAGDPDGPLERRMPDGTWAQPQASTDAASQAALAVAAGARSPATAPHGGDYYAWAFAWTGGARATLGYRCIDSLCEAPNITWGAHGPLVLAGPAGYPLPGRTRGAITIFTADHGRLYAMARPAGPDTRAPRIVLHPVGPAGQSAHTLWLAYGDVDERASVQAHAVLEISGGTQPAAATTNVSPGLHPPFRGFGVHITAADFERVNCHPAQYRQQAAYHLRFSVTVSATDAAGRRSTRTLAVRVGCLAR